MNKKARIIEETYPDGSIKFIIQQKHFLFFWWWVAASLNYFWLNRMDVFSTQEDAKKNLYKFNGTKTVSRVVSFKNEDILNKKL